MNSPQHLLNCGLSTALRLSALALAIAAGPALAQAEATWRTGSVIEMRASAGGTLYVAANIADQTMDLLLDTGAGISTLSRADFERLNDGKTYTPIHQVGARLANGQIELMDVYRIERLRLGKCMIDALDVAVPERGGRNLLGISALQQLSPFTVHLSPPALEVTGCTDGDWLAGSP